MSNCIPTLKIKNKVFTGNPVDNNASVYTIIESVLSANREAINKLLFELLEPSELTDYKDITKLAGNITLSKLLTNLSIQTTSTPAALESLYSLQLGILHFKPKILLVDGDIKLNGVSIPNINISDEEDLIVLNSLDIHTIHNIFLEYIWRKIAQAPKENTLTKINKLYTNKYDPNTCYEVSTSVSRKGYIGDARFSAFNAKFKEPIIVPGGELAYANSSIENVYQYVIKKSGKNLPPAKDSMIHYDNVPEFSMYFNYKNRKRDDVTATSTFDAIINGERTSTTRYNNEYANSWRKLKIGQVIRLRDTEKPGSTSRHIYVKILSKTEIPSTKQWTELELEEWSQNEGWSLEYAKNEMANNIKTKNGGIIVRYLFLYEEDPNWSEKEKFEELSYLIGYLPLWEEWARLHQTEMQELIKDSEGKILSDEHADTRVSLARALAEIISSLDTSLLDFTLHSGGAEGSDEYWDKIGRKYGLIKANHYYWEGETDDKKIPPYKNISITLDDYNEGVSKAALAGKRNYGYSNKYVRDSRLIRNWALVKYSDAIFAIGTIVNPGEWLFPNNKEEQEDESKRRYAVDYAVAGGTGYAIGMAINEGNELPYLRKDIYVFDLNKGKWFIWDWFGQTWQEYNDTPILTKNFAGIGTREINAKGKWAIQEVYKKTLQYYKLSNSDLPKINREEIIVNRVNEILSKEKERNEKNLKLLELNATLSNVWDIICRNETFLEILDNEYIEGLTNREYLKPLLNGDYEPSASKLVEKKLILTQRGLERLKELLKYAVDQYGGGKESEDAVKNSLKDMKKGLDFNEVKNQLRVFSNEEVERIKKALRGGKLFVQSASRNTDPAFYSKELVKIITDQKNVSFDNPNRINVVEIWSKHDGLPIIEVLKACKDSKVAPMVSFSITGLGGTEMEPGVLRYNDLFDQIEELINLGYLHPETTTIRIDPIVPGITKKQDVENIIVRARSLGINKFVTSIMQSYGYLETKINQEYIQLENERRAKKGWALLDPNRRVVSRLNDNLRKLGLNPDEYWETYYGLGEATRNIRGTIKKEPCIPHLPKKKVIEDITAWLNELIAKYNDISMKSCAFALDGLASSACLDPELINIVSGVDVRNSDGSYYKDKSRENCVCYGCHGELLRFAKWCGSSCGYCYVGNENKSPIKYYNEDGTLKTSIYSTTNKDTFMEEHPWITVTKNGHFQITNSQGQILEFDTEENLAKMLLSRYKSLGEEGSATVAATILSGVGQNGKIEDMNKYIDEVINDC